MSRDNKKLLSPPEYGSDLAKPHEDCPLDDLELEEASPRLIQPLLTV